MSPEPQLTPGFIAYERLIEKEGDEASGDAVIRAKCEIRVLFLFDSVSL